MKQTKKFLTRALTVLLVLMTLMSTVAVGVTPASAATTAPEEYSEVIDLGATPDESAKGEAQVETPEKKPAEEDDSAAKEEEKAPARPGKDVADLGANVEVAPTAWNQSAVTIYFDAGSWSVKTLYVLIGHGSWSSCYSMTKDSGTVYKCSVPSWDGATEWYVINADGGWGDEGSSPTNRKSWAYDASSKRTSALTAGTLYTSSGTKTFTVTFKDWDGTTLKTQTGVGYKKGATAPSNPSRASTAQYSYTFSKWDKSYSSVTSNLTVTAVYTSTVRSYTITVGKAAGSGTVSGGGTYNYGTSVTIKATPSTGYSFTKWSDGNTSASRTITVTGNATYNATFTINTYKLTLNRNYAYGTVSGGGTYNYNTKVSISASPNTGYHFVNWTVTSGNSPASTTAASTTVTLTKATTLQANFAINTYTLTLNRNNNSYGTVSGAGTYNYNTAASIKATPATGYHFTGWTKNSGNSPASTSAASTTVTLTSNTTLTANFAINTYTVTFKDHDGTTLKTQTVNHGSAATAPDNPSRTGYNFAGWDKSFSSITANTTVTATYTIKTYTVTFKDDAAVGGGTLKTQTVNHGSAATAPSVSTSGGWEFYSWDKEFSNITANTTVTAVRSNKNVQLLGDGNIGGWTSGTSRRMTYNSNGTNTKTVTLPKGTYELKIFEEEWSEWLGNNGTVNDSCDGWDMYNGNNLTLNASGGKYTFTFNRNTNKLSISYTAVTYTITGKANTGGSVSPTSKTVNLGDTVTLTATPSTGYHFTSWSVGSGATITSGSTTSKSITVTVSGNATCTASFAGNAGTVSYAAGTGGSVSNSGDNSVTYPNEKQSKATAATGYSFSKWTISGGTKGTDYEISTGSTTSATIGIKVITAGKKITATASFDPTIRTVQFIAGTGGSVSNSGSHSTTYPNTQSSTATASYGYNFSSWSITGGTAGTDYKITAGGTDQASITIQPLVNGDTIKVTANFSKKSYTVTATAGTGGNASAGATSVKYGNTTTVTATPATGYKFVKWEITSNDSSHASTLSSTTANPATLTVNCNVTVKAHFEKQTYTVTVTKTPSAGGSVSANSTSVKYKESTTITATPATGYNFTKWEITSGTGSLGSSTSASTTLTVESNVTVKATFTIKKYTVTFKDQSDFGGETLSTVTVEHGSAATAPSVPTEGGWEYWGWDKDFSNVTGNMTVTVVRANKNVQLMGLNSGWTTGTGMRMTYNSNGTNTKTVRLTKGTYELKIYTEEFGDWRGNNGTVVDTTDTTASAGWDMDGGNNLTLEASGGNYTFTYYRNTNKLKITYSPLTNTVTASASPTAGGSATVTTKNVKIGDVTTITATANKGYTFSKWTFSGDYTIESGSATSTSVTIKPNGSSNGKTVTATATFVGNAGTVKYAATAGGTVTNAGENAVTFPNEVKSTATVSEGYTFSKWSITGGTEGTDYEISTGSLSATTIGIKVYTKNKTITATAAFTANTSTIQFATSTGGSVSNSGSHSTTYPNTAKSTATPAASHNFVKWTITGGTKGTDYKIVSGSETSATIEIQPLTKGKTIKATAEFAIKTYTVTFKNWDGTQLSSQVINHGSAATAPTTPTRPATAQYSYIFKSWDKDFSNVTSNLIVTATYTETIRSYTVTFKDYDGEVLKEESVKYGSGATAPSNPSRTDGFIFDGWDKAYNNITGDLTVTAKYYDDNVYLVGIKGVWEATSSTKMSYANTSTKTYTLDEGAYEFKFIYRGAWLSNNGEIINTTDYAGSSNPWETYDGNNCRLSAVGGTYEFKFNKTTRHFEVKHTPITYTVKFISDGKTVSTQKVNRGEDAKAPANPIKAADAQYTYTFAGWDKDYTGVRSDLTITAQFTKTLNKYTVTFKDYEGTVLKTEQVEYGKAATAPASPSREGYNFAGWDADFSKITGDLVVTAKYAVKTYTVKFVDYNGTALKTQVVEHGQSATAPQNPTRPADAQYTYTFKEWDKAFNKVTENLTVTATYTQTVNYYTVKFVNYDGYVYSTQSVAYGSAATAPSNPKRTDGWNFIGWDVDYSNIKGNTTVTAQWEDNNVYLMGVTGTWDKNDSTLSQIRMTYNNTATMSLQLNAGSYKFKFIYKDTWRGNNGTLTDTTNNNGSSNPWETDPNAGDITLNATGGLYTFKYNKSNNRFEVLFVSNAHDVTFKNWDGSVIATKKVPDGESAAAYAPAASRPATVQYTYTHSGWTPDINAAVTSDKTFTATYTETLNKYTVTFVNWDDTVLKTEQVEYGKAATAPTTTPTKAGDVQYSYTFSGWDKDFSNIKGATTVKAEFTPVLNKYNVTFVYYKADGKTQTSTVVETEYGKAAQAPTVPARTDGMAFEKWDKGISNIVSDLTVNAIYYDNNYYLKGSFDNWGTGKKLNTYGDTVVTTTIKLDPGTYTFKINQASAWLGNGGIIQDTTTTTSNVGWEMSTSADDCTLKASGGTYIFKYNTNTKMLVVEYEPTMFTVTFKNWDGTVIGTEKVAISTAAKGPATPTKPSTAQYIYTFTGWDKDISKVTSDITTTAQFMESVRQYTVTFVYVKADGTETSVDKLVEYGRDAQAPELPRREDGWEFSGWDKSFKAIQGDLTVTAQYIDGNVYLPASFNGFNEKAERFDLTNDENVYVQQVTLDPGTYEFKLKVGDGWYGNNGTINDATTTAWKMETGTNNCTIDATGGTYTFTFNKSTQMLTVDYDPYKYTVTFVDNNNKEIDKQTVAIGTAASDPKAKVPFRADGYAFEKWDKDFTNVQGNMTVKAQYFDNNVYLKGTFNNWDNSNKLTTYGNDVTSTRVELAPGTYEFKFFRNNLVDGAVTGTYYTDTNAGTVKDTTGNDWWNTVTSDPGNTKLNATGGWYTFSFNSKTGAFHIAYEPYMYTVTYKDYNGKVLGTEKVAIGTDAKGMATPKRTDGYEFHYWEPSIKNIQGDTTVTAVYYDHNVYLTGSFNNWSTGALKMTPDGDNVVKARVELATGEYQFKFYQKNLVNGEIVENWYTDQNAGVVDNTTLKAWWHTVDNTVENRHTTLTANGGFYEFSYATDTRDFHIFYDAYTFEVIFRDYNENVLKTEQVPIGTAATPPKTPTRAGGWVFHKWDVANAENDDFSEIWKPTTIYATYYDANVYLKGDFNNWGTNHKLTQYGDRYLSVTLALEPGTYDFKFFQNRLDEDLNIIGELYTDINAGTIIDEMEEDEWWDTTTEDPGDTNLVAKGGWYTFTFDTETKKFNVSYKPNVFDVTFVYYSADGKELINDVQQVRLGEDAVAPEIPVRTDGWVFDKWDKEFTNIQDDLTVTALYIDENIYIAGSFNSWNEKATPMPMTSDKNVVKVTLEFAPGEYEFKIVKGDGWYTDGGTIPDTTDFNGNSNPWQLYAGDDRANTKLNATGGYYTFTFNKTTNKLEVKYSPYMYTVTFVDYEGKVLKAEEVAISKSATAPTVPERTDGWVFIGWDKDFSKITEDITVTAQYRDDNVYLRGFEGDWTQGITMTNNSDNTATVTVRNLTAGTYTFKFFYDGQWYTNTGVVENSAENWETYGSDTNCTLQSAGGSHIFTFNKETKRFSVEFKPNIYEITFKYYGKTSADPRTDVVQVLAGESVELPALETRTDSWYYIFWAERGPDDKPQGTRYTETITNVQSDMTIEAWYYDDNVYLLGPITDDQWRRTEENKMLYDFASGTSYMDVHLDPGQYNFKLIYRHDENMVDYMYGNNGTIYDSAYNWDMSTTAGDCVLNASGGTYTFTFNRNTKQLSVHYVPDVFTVTFVEYDGTILDTQEVTIQQAAKEPAHAQRTDGWVFFGWDSDTATPGLQGNTQKIMGDTTFTASYYDDNVYLAGDFNNWNETEPMGPSYTSRPLVTSMYLEPGKYEFKLLRNGAWYGNDGTIVDTTTTTSATGWEMKTEEGNCTLEATGGYYTFKYNPDTKMLEVLYDATRFYVRFLDWNATVLKEGYVSRGDSAVPPTEIPTKEGDAQYSYTFTGWDVDFSNIQENLDVTAVYLQTVNEYKVTFKYYDTDGSTLISDEQMVPYGSAAVAPEVPKREDRWIFSHWDVDFTNITGDLTVTAQYINGNVFLAGTFNDWNETTLPMLQKTDNPDEFAVTITLHHGEEHQFKIKVGDNWYGNIGEFTDTTDVDGKSNPWDMIHTTSTEGNCTINTTGGYYTYTYNIKTSKLDVKYAPFVYTVTFIDYNDVVISEQKIEITKDAELPTAPKRTGGFEFLGWDSDLSAEGIQDDCKNIMKDMTFYAQYYDNNLYLKGSLNNWGTNNMLTEYGEKIVTTTIELGRGVYTFKFYRESYDENGDLIKVYYTDINAGRFTDSTQGWWTATDDPGVGNTTLDATGGWYTFEFNNETEEFRVIYEPYKYTVTFVDWDNTVLKTETLAVGSAAVAPEDPTREATVQYNYVFAGWDQDFSYVESDMTIKALYDAIANDYTVTFVDWDGTVLKTEEVLVGTAATAPEAPTRDGGWQFAGWDKDFSDIQGDLTVTAQYYDDNIYLVGSFNGWDKDNKLNTYGDLVVATRVELAPGTYEFKFMHNGTYYTDKYEGTVVNTTGENWWGTTTSGDVGNTKLQADGGWYTFTFDTVTKEFHVAYEPYYYTVKFVDWDGTLLKEETVQVATSAHAPEDPTREHYNFTGWDKDFSNIQGDFTVTAQYKIHNFKVTFVYYAEDSKTLIYDEQTVDYSSPATAPENIPVRNDGWVFNKWDKDFSYITEDTTVTALYIDDNVYLVGEFNGWNETKHPFKLTDNPDVVILTLNIDGDTEFKLKRGDGWFSNDGTIPDTTDLDGKSNPWDMSTSVNENCMLDASGGSYTFIYNKTTQKLEVKYAPYMYIVRFVNWDGTLLKEETVQISWHATPPADPTRPADDQYAYIFAGWDTTAYNNVKSDLTVTATYTQVINEFTVKFVNWDGTVISEQKVVYGKDAIEPAETPTRDKDAQFTYTFKGWDKEFTGITADTVVTATYDFTPNIYTVTFVDWNGKVLETEKVVYGNAATAPKDPTRENYLFTGWDKDFTKVEGDLTVTATYVDNRVYLKGDFNNWKDNLVMKPTGNENEVSITIKVDEGVPEFKLEHQGFWYGNDGVIIDTTETTSPGLGWEMSDSAGNCVLDATGGNYTFIYNTEKHMLKVLYEAAEYTVIFQYEDGTVISEQKVKYGQAATAPADPTKEGHVFVGWDPADFEKIIEDTIITAIFAEAGKVFTVTFVDFDGTELSQVQVVSGQAAPAPADPTREGDAQYSYIFAGWDKDFTAVSEDMTVTATYTQVINKYKVTFVDWDDTVLKEEEIEYGQAAVAPEDPTREGYVFTGWDAEFTEITGETIVKATYAEENSEFTVTFVDWDGTVLSTQQVQAGTAAVAPENPTRTEDAQYTYTFKEWDQDFSAVMSDMTITAVYTETLRKYTVTYYNYNGAYFYSEQVEYGKAALGPMSTPTRPTSNGRTYTFDHWDKQDELGYVTGNISTKAVFTSSAITYTVTFVSYDGSVLKTQQVRHGGSATAPAKPAVPAGYTSTWNPADFSYITSNLTVRLELIDNNVYIIGDMNDWTAAIMSQTSTNGNIYSKKYTLEAGLYEFKFQYPKDTWYGNNGTVYDSTGGWWSTSQADGNITLQATGGTYEFQFNKQTKQMQVIFNAPEYTVIFVDWNGTELNTQKVKQGNKAIAPANPHRADDAMYSYTFTGWDPSVDNPIMGNTTFVAQYSSSPLTYTVNFVDWDGTLLSSQAVEYGGAATEPAHPTRDNYTFIGWDSDAYVNVTGNLTINAEYVGNTYNVTVQQTTGGTTSANKAQVEYPSTVTLTAAPSSGYSFTGWTIEGKYEIVSSTAMTLEVRPTSDITVKATYAKGVSLTIHGYSTHNWYNLYMWERNSSGTENHPLGEWSGTTMQVPTVFNDVEWKTIVDVTMTDGYSAAIGAILNGTGGQTEDIMLQSLLYKNGSWAGIREIWIADNDGETIVTLRRDLLDYIDMVTGTYNGGENVENYTTPTWNDFVDAYENAFGISGDSASTQDDVDAALEDLRIAYENLKKRSYNLINIHQIGGVGSVTVGDVTITTANGSAQVANGEDATMLVEAPEGYYITSVISNGDVLFTNTNLGVIAKSITIREVTETQEVEVHYATKSAYTITVEAYDKNMGTIYYNNKPVNPDGEIITVFAGNDATFKAEAKDGYAVYEWTVDGSKIALNKEITINDINENHTVSVTWQQVKVITVTVDAKPAAAGNASAKSEGQTASTTTQNHTITINQFDSVTLTAVVTDPLYDFAGWSIKGDYTEADGTSRLDKVFNIIATDDIEATAMFVQVYRKIYLENDANWKQPYLYYWGSDKPSEDWPGEKMTFDSTTGYWVGYIPVDTTDIQFNDGTNANQVEFSDVTPNLYNNGTGSSGTHVEQGYYLQGIWDGVNHTAEDLYKFDVDNGDGSYSITITVNSTSDGYIYVNPTNELSEFWNAEYSGKTDNPQILDYIGMYTENPNFVKVELNPYDLDAGYEITFTFNPETGEFSWTKKALVPSITIIGTDGRGTNSADVDMMTSNDRVGKTYFASKDVMSVTTFDVYETAQVLAGNPVTFYTKVNDNGFGAYDYYVYGWVINGTEFVPAYNMGDGLYSGSYIFTKDMTNVVPVYFHTKEWLAAHGVEQVTVYAVADKDIENWNQYLSVYTWCNDEDGLDYEQFGLFAGQLMIPVAGLDGVYYTFVETTSASGTPVSGIIFNNYAKNENFNTVIVDYSTLQSYDFYEFMALLEDGKDNITFVIKDTNDDLNSGRVEDDKDAYLNNFTFEQYTDYSKIKIDIFGNSIEDIDATLSDVDAVYIIQAGDTPSYDAPLSGDHYVKCYIYDAAGTFLGSCFSYELHDKDSAIWAILEPYKNQRAYISYEKGNEKEEGTGERYDGEWYGDSNLDVTINVSVNVGLTTDGGQNFYVNTTDPVNVATYGSGYVNVSYQNVDVKRGEQITLTATPARGYKFIGWYSADGTLFSTNRSYTVIAAVGTTYTAVFEEMSKGNFYVNHYLYTGVATTQGYIPTAHGGNAQLYVGITNETMGISTDLTLTDTAFIEARVGDILTITIGTDAVGADKFYAWYVEAMEKNGFTSFEEVGVDSLDNLFNNRGTVVGRSDMVYFQFKYIVKENDSYTMTLYSDLMPVSADVTLVYNYNDRNGDVKTLYVPYTLTIEEIEGFAGNNYKPYTPAFISGENWINTVLACAPFVADLAKDTTWVINSAMYDTLTFVLWATQPEKLFTITSQVGDSVLVTQGTYDSLYTIDVRNVDSTISETGFWYNDVNNDGRYTQGIDLILTYGPLYSYRITCDMNINFEETEEFDFNITIDEPAYGREQTSNEDGSDKKDKVTVDYMINILTPYFYGQGEGNNFKPTDNLIGNPTGQHVTVESLRNAGYTISYGVILEQVGSFAPGSAAYPTFMDALKAAQAKNYGVATDYAILKDVVENYKKPIMTSAGTYCTVYDTSNYELTNKNRYGFAIGFNNTAANQKKFYNVYSYMTVITPDGVKTTYISNVQTLNIYTMGTTGAVTADNASFD